MTRTTVEREVAHIMVDLGNLANEYAHDYNDDMADFGVASAYAHIDLVRLNTVSKIVSMLYEGFTLVYRYDLSSDYINEIYIKYHGCKIGMSWYPDRKDII